ncbi:MAG: ABC transporter ATP-binding protein [Bacillales bacterium]|nr:ABC transporter ATP-binding protein [Bacillales bacterium]
MKVLEVKNLTKYYGKSRGIKNVSFEIDEGMVFGFIGPNGAGKSTTIRCIMNELNVTSGSILYKGKPLLKNDKESYKEIGYLPSEVHLYEELKVADMYKYNDSFYKEDTLKRAYELSEILGIETNRKIKELSLGNKQKIGFVLSIAHSPKIVIMDEVTAGLDPLVQEAVYQIIKEEKAKGTAFFFSSHNLPEVKKVCDKVAIIKEGEIIKIASVDELTSTEGLKVKVYTKDDLKDDFKDLKTENGCKEFIYDRDINSLLKILNKYKIERLLIEEPSIEEIFRHYYR